jgi:SET domain-containing protein
MNVRLGRSPIHGTGAFAERAFTPGETIIEYAGERISHDEADLRTTSESADEGHTMMFILDDETVIDGSINGNEARYVNHSCDPNCEAVIYEDNVLIEALRPIQPGEELFIDYCLVLSDPSLVEAYRCCCGSHNCRGTMLDAAHGGPALREG